MRLMYENRTASIQSLILRLVIWCALLCPEKYGTCFLCRLIKVLRIYQSLTQLVLADKAVLKRAL